MNENHFGFRIRKLLNRGVHELDPATTERLRAAREQALARQKAPALALAPAYAGKAPAFLSFPALAPQRHMLLALLFCFSIAVAGLYGYSDYHVRAIGEIEIALLADDLPVEAFLDKGFEEWLQNLP